MNLILDYYRQMFCSMKMGRNSTGGKSTAKPIFLLSILEYIPQCGENLFKISDENLKECYKKNFMIYDKENYTRMVYPYYHISRESFYSICWRNPSAIPELQHSPSAKTLEKHIVGAQLDQELWNLLQDEGNRKFLRECIIKEYLSDQTE